MTLEELNRVGASGALSALHDHDNEGPDWINELNRLVNQSNASGNRGGGEEDAADVLLRTLSAASSQTSLNSLPASTQSTTTTTTMRRVLAPSIRIESSSGIHHHHHHHHPQSSISDDTALATSRSNSGRSSPHPPPTPLPVPTRPTTLYKNQHSSSSTDTLTGGGVDSRRTLADVVDELQRVHRQQQHELLRQLLKLKNVSADWFDIVMPLALECVDLVKPDVKHDNDQMDIRHYIKIKKLHMVTEAAGAGAVKRGGQLINGLVFTKHVAHKEMRDAISSPKILLLRSSIEYTSRTEDAKMCSLEPIFAAEAQYLKNHCSKLLLRQRPDVLIVEKSVARLAQDYLLHAGVSLVLNVKASIMDKLARFLQADPMYSIDDLVRQMKTINKNVNLLITNQHQQQKVEETATRLLFQIPRGDVSCVDYGRVEWWQSAKVAHVLRGHSDQPRLHRSAQRTVCQRTRRKWIKCDSWFYIF